MSSEGNCREILGSFVPKKCTEQMDNSKQMGGFVTKEGSREDPKGLVAQTVAMHKDSNTCYITWFGGSFA